MNAHIIDGRYHCQTCNRSFIRTGIACTVLHAPGTCCHMGEMEACPTCFRLMAFGRCTNPDCDHEDWKQSQRISTRSIRRIMNRRRKLKLPATLRTEARDAWLYSLGLGVGYWIASHSWFAIAITAIALPFALTMNALLAALAKTKVPTRVGPAPTLSFRMLMQYEKSEKVAARVQAAGKLAGIDQSLVDRLINSMAD